MISTDNITLSFTGTTLFENVSVKFVPGNCYGLIGANGAGKSTFLKILSGEIESTSGTVCIDNGKRLSFLRQDQFAFDEYSAMETVLMGDKALYEVYAERMALYAKTDMSEAEGLRVAELEEKFAELDGYMAEANAGTMLDNLGLPEDLQTEKMANLEAGQKIRVLLAQALFNEPDILLLDEPTNQLDYQAKMWLENFLLDFKNTVIVISHDRHFLNKVCTHIADLDFKKISIFVGNYDFWYTSSQLIQKQKQDQHKKAADKIAELQDFVRRFSANASKSKQATSRKKLIDKLRPEELPVSSRRYPFINFNIERPCGNKILTVKGLKHSLDGNVLFQDVSFTLEKNDKLALLAENTLAKTTLLQILAGEIEPDEGSVEWGETISTSYFPKDNTDYFSEKTSLFEWLDKLTTQIDSNQVRSLLGRMLFSGDDVEKNVSVLSGGEKARAMFSRMMLKNANLIILDEPTDHLDLESISALNEGLSNFKEVLIVTSYDIELLETVANRVIEISSSGIIDEKMGFMDFMNNSRVQEKRKKLILS